MKNLFIFAGVSGLLVAQGCASHQPVESSTAAFEKAVPVHSVSLKMGAEPSKKKKKTVLTGRGTLHFTAGGEPSQPSDAGASSNITCDIPVAFSVSGDSAALNAALHQAFKTLGAKGGEGPNYSFTSGFIRHRDQDYGPLEEGTVSDFFGEYELRSDEELKKFDGGKSHLFENKSGLLFGFPAAGKLKGAAKIAIEKVDGQPESSQNALCVDIAKKGFAIASPQ